MHRELDKAILKSCFDCDVLVFEKDGLGFCLCDFLPQVDYFFLKMLDVVFFALAMFAMYFLASVLSVLEGRWGWVEIVYMDTGREVKLGEGYK